MNLRKQYLSEKSGMIGSWTHQDGPECTRTKHIDNNLCTGKGKWKMSPNHKAISIWKVLVNGNPISQMGCHWLYQPHFRADMGFLLISVCVRGGVFMLSFSFVLNFLTIVIFLYYFLACLLYFSNLFWIVVLLCFWERQRQWSHQAR